MILLLTGPAGAGKSTTAKAFLDSAQGTWAYLGQDELRQLVKTGYAVADDYEHNWSDAVRQQWQVTIPLSFDMARRYEEAGINCVVDFNASPEEFTTWQKHLKDLKYKLVVLMPGKATVLARNRERPIGSKLKDNKIIQNYEKLARWNKKDAIIIDNSQDSISKTVILINRFVNNK